MSPTFPHLRDLLADWQHRLRECRITLRIIGDHHPKAQLLLIHERVLSYLLNRYQHNDGPSDGDDGRPTVSVPLMQRKFPAGAFCWYELPDDAVPSSLFPPRSQAELRAHLMGIHTSLNEAPKRRAPWLWRRLPRLGR